MTTSKDNEGGGNNRLSPQRKKDRSEAFLISYTSAVGECPFYESDNPDVLSKCLLDPKTSRNWDCRGVCFFQGRCCKFLVSDEDRETDEKSR